MFRPTSRRCNNAVQRYLFILIIVFLYSCVRQPHMILLFLYYYSSEFPEDNGIQMAIMVSKIETGSHETVLVHRKRFQWGFKMMYLFLYTCNMLYLRSSRNRNFLSIFIKFCANFNFYNSLKRVVGRRKPIVFTSFLGVSPKVWNLEPQTILLTKISFCINR